jgi:hypothetical protein
MTERRGACCSSPAAMCYWFAVSLMAWGVLSLIGIYWPPLHAWSAAAILFAMAIGCFANWLRHRTFHCGITGPLFLIAAVVFLVSDVSKVHISSLLIWPFVHRSRHRVFAGMAVCEASRSKQFQHIPAALRGRGLLMFSTWKNSRFEGYALASLGGETGNVREGVRHAAGGGL